MFLIFLAEISSIVTGKLVPIRDDCFKCLEYTLQSKRTLAEDRRVFVKAQIIELNDMSNFAERREEEKEMDFHDNINSSEGQIQELEDKLPEMKKT